MRVALLGSSGMLGHVVARYLAERGHDILHLAHRFEIPHVAKFAEWLQNLQADWLINCVAMNPRKASHQHEFFDLNVLLPAICIACAPRNIRIIQPSSDAVFSPEKADRDVEEKPDALDAYGLSKRCCEEVVSGTSHYVIRSSIIGPERNGTTALLSWFLSQSNPVKGYVNHMWNGITTLEWAKLSDRIISGDFVEKRLLQPGFVPCVSKYDLLGFIQTIWKHNVMIEPIVAPKPILRSLTPNLVCVPIVRQLAELKEWYG